MTKTAKKIIIELAVLLAVVLTDLATKYLVFYLFEEGGATVIDGVFSIQCAQNYGASFGIFSGNKTLLIALTFVECAIFAFVLLFRPNTPHIFRFSLLLILGGAIGNLFDRLAFGYVRDFVWLLIVNAYCNFADFWIVIGGIMAVLDMLFFNEWAVFPLTKKAKEAQAEHKKKEEEKKLSAATAGSLSTSSDDVDCKGENSKKEGEKLSEGGEKADDSPSQGDESHE